MDTRLHHLDLIERGMFIGIRSRILQLNVQLSRSAVYIRGWLNQSQEDARAREFSALL
jgi:hypothetical protein